MSLAHAGLMGWNCRLPRSLASLRRWGSSWMAMISVERHRVRYVDEEPVKRPPGGN